MSSPSLLLSLSSSWSVPTFHVEAKSPFSLSFSQPEFAHFWLPQLVEAHSVAVVANFNNPWTRVILLLGVNVNPIFDRYCRSPVEGVALRECFYRLCGAQIEEHTIRLERVRSSSSAIKRVEKVGPLILFPHLLGLLSSSGPHIQPPGLKKLNPTSWPEIGFNSSVTSRSPRSSPAVLLPLPLTRSPSTSCSPGSSAFSTSSNAAKETSLLHTSKIWRFLPGQVHGRKAC